MQTSSSVPAVIPNTAAVPGRPAGSGETALKKTAADFEALFVSMMLKSMRESMSQDMFAGDAGDTYGGLFDSYLAQHIAEHGGIGLADMIMKSGLSPAELSSGLRSAEAGTADSRAVSDRTKQMEAYRNAGAFE